MDKAKFEFLRMTVSNRFEFEHIVISSQITESALNYCAHGGMYNQICGLTEFDAVSHLI